MNIEIIIYVFTSIFVVLGLTGAIWSFIDTHRIRSAKDYSQDQVNKREAAHYRYKKNRLGK